MEEATCQLLNHRGNVYYTYNTAFTGIIRFRHTYALH